MTATATGLAAADGATLLAVASGAIRHALGVGPAWALPDAGPLAEPRGAFVKVTVAGELRGWVGTVSPAGPLASAVARHAVGAALEDPRFAPVSAQDLDDLEIEVSVLEPRRPMSAPSDIRVGRDGIVVTSGWHRGVLLPSSARESGWDAVTFLDRACLKAGLPPGAWRDPGAVVELFSAEELG